MPAQGKQTAHDASASSNGSAPAHGTNVSKVSRRRQAAIRGTVRFRAPLNGIAEKQPRTFLVLTSPASSHQQEAADARGLARRDAHKDPRRPRSLIPTCSVLPAPARDESEHGRAVPRGTHSGLASGLDFGCLWLSASVATLPTSAASPGTPTESSSGGKKSAPLRRRKTRQQGEGSPGCAQLAAAAKATSILRQTGDGFQLTHPAELRGPVHHDGVRDSCRKSCQGSDVDGAAGSFRLCAVFCGREITLQRENDYPTQHNLSPRRKATYENLHTQLLPGTSYLHVTPQSS